MNHTERLDLVNLGKIKTISLVELWGNVTDLEHLERVLGLKLEWCGVNDLQPGQHVLVYSPDVRQERAGLVIAALPTSTAQEHPEKYVQFLILFKGDVYQTLTHVPLTVWRCKPLESGQ